MVDDKIKPSERKCVHCKMGILVRNPSGFCDHLFYPENCKVCTAREMKSMGRKKNSKVWKIQDVRRC